MLSGISSGAIACSRGLLSLGVSLLLLSQPASFLYLIREAPAGPERPQPLFPAQACCLTEEIKQETAVILPEACELVVESRWEIRSL